MAIAAYDRASRAEHWLLAARMHQTAGRTQLHFNIARAARRQKAMRCSSMEAAGVALNLRTYSALINAASKSGLWREAAAARDDAAPRHRLTL